jgi:hypothetical protein
MSREFFCVPAFPKFLNSHTQLQTKRYIEPAPHLSLWKLIKFPPLFHGERGTAVRGRFAFPAPFITL